MARYVSFRDAPITDAKVIKKYGPTVPIRNFRPPESSHREREGIFPEFALDELVPMEM